MKAPNLEGIAQNPKDPALTVLRLWLRNPRAIKRDTAMPNFHLSDSEIEALISYLRFLDQYGAPPSDDHESRGKTQKWEEIFSTQQLQ